MRDSKFLRKEDVGPGVLMTITDCEKHNVAMEGADPHEKWCLKFTQTDKPLVLNAINTQLLETICESGDTDDWRGKAVVLYTDPTVQYAGRIVGGIRVRAPKRKLATSPVVAPLNDDDIPF
jgi:hypothetical protein